MSENELHGIIGRNPAMLKVMSKISRAAATESTVLVTGESGTGKELVARAIHAMSGRSHSQFLPVNCGAIVKSLAESEFFGHARGSFTGSTGSRKGLFEQASGGTLFLDEVAETEPDLQVKLFRAIQDREVTPVGSNTPIKVNVRIVAASSENRLDAMRDELFYRVNVIRIKLPPLRERQDDIEVLARTFLERYATAAKRKLDLLPDAMALLRSHDWPGNVRQLQHVVESAVALAEGPVIAVDELEEILQDSCRRSLPSKVVSRSAPVSSVSDTDSLKAEVDLGSAIRAGLTLEDLERLYITQVVKTGCSVPEAAAKLGVALKTVYNKIAKYGLRGGEEAGS